MIEPKLLLKGTFYPDDIKVNVAKESNRKVDPEIEAKINDTWRKSVDDATKNGQLIFDGESYRVEEFKVEENKLNIVFSKMRYKIRSSLSVFVDELSAKGEDYLPHTSAIGGFVKTSDNKFVFGNKSGKTVSKTAQDFIGGIVEFVDIESGADLFECNYIEMKEEANLDKSDIKDMKIIAVVANKSGNIVFVTSSVLKLSSKEVLEKFNSKQGSGYEEMASLEFVDRDKLAEHLEKLDGYKKVLVEFVDGL